MERRVRLAKTFREEIITWATQTVAASCPRLSRQGCGDDNFSDVPMDDLVHGLAAFILSPDGDRVVAGAETEDDGHAG